MVKIRKAADRGSTRTEWLDSRHSFSFADYHDPEQMGFRSLRVINDDRVAPGTGFGLHPHANMEILTYVLEGRLAHRDSMGNGSVIGPGELQRMSAGTGVLHSEMNPSEREPVHLLQIWILPEERGLAPSYEQRRFPPDQRRGRLQLVASRDGREGSLHLHQDAAVYLGLLGPGDRVAIPLAPRRQAWVQVARGALTLDGRTLDEGDGAAVEDERQLELAATADSEVLVFDLA